MTDLFNPFDLGPINLRNRMVMANNAYPRDRR
jgi:2,4-dienoyl-CoA reductase-like NADH-dependent reductase (Old Yellow Enzyme family)